MHFLPQVAITLYGFEYSNDFTCYGVKAEGADRVAEEEALPSGNGLQGSAEPRDAATDGAQKKRSKRVKKAKPAPVTSEDAKVNHLVPRTLIYAVGVLLNAFGVVMNTRCDMGTSTVNCIPFVFSEATGITLGQGCIILYAIDIVIQIIVFRKLTVRMALQLPFSFLFGFLVDFYDDQINSGLLTVFQNPDIAMGTFMLFFGIVCTGIGVSMMMSMNYVPNPPDGCTQSVCKLTGLPFGHGKWLNDAIRLVIACVLGMVMVGQVIGVGIGTVLCVFLIGNVCQFTDDHVGRWYRKAYNPMGIVD